MIQTHQYEWLFFGLIIIIVSTKLAHVYTIANLGESISLNLGISYKKLEWLTLLLVSLTTSVTMITVGSLPFIGIIIPNLVRYLSGDDLKKTIPQTALLGAVLVLACDIVARLVIRPYEVSVSLILGIVGAGLLISQILRISSQRRGSIR